MHINRKILEYLFTGSITIKRWRLRVMYGCMFGVGVLFALFFLTKQYVLPFVFAASSPWTQTDWSGGQGSSTINQYSSASNIDAISTSGQLTLTNTEELSNTGFETDLSGWTGTLSYTLYDEFTDTLSAGSVNGTTATPGPGTRTVVDTNSKISVNGTSLSFATGAAVNDGIWYPAEAGVAGKIFAVKVTPADTSGLIAVGWDSNSTGAINDSLRFNTTTGIQIVPNGGTAITVGSYAGATTYTVVSIMRSTGIYWFIKGGTYTSMTLIYYTTAGTGTKYAAVQAQNTTSVFTIDYVRTPTSTWLPNPVAYDTFNRSNGLVGSSETTGPDSQTLTPSVWNSSTWSVASNYAVNTPNLGADLVSNGSFETGNPPTGWSPSGTSVFEQSSTRAQDGTYSLRITGGYGYQFLGLTNQAWYIGTTYLYPIVGGTYDTFHVGNGAQYLYIPTGQWTKIVAVGRASSGGSVYLDPYSTNEIYYDNVTVKALPLNELFATQQTNTPNVIEEAAVTVESQTTLRTPTGLVLRLDNKDSPQNFIIVYVTAGGCNNWGTIVAEKSVNGSYSSIFSTALGCSNMYISGEKLRAQIIGTTLRVYYGSILVNTVTVDHENLNNNTLHGIFSPYSGNKLDNFLLYAGGTSGEYSALPYESLDESRNTSTTYNSSSGSTKIIWAGNYYQSLNVGDTNQYNFTGYAYKDGTEVSASDAELYYNGSTISTSYTSVGSGWYKLTGTLTGADALRNYGVQVKSGRTMYVDNLSLSSYAPSGSLTSNILDTDVASDWGNLNFTSNTPSNTAVAVRIRSGNNADLSDATEFSSCSSINSGSDFSGGCSSDSKRYVQYQVALSTTNTTTTPNFSDITMTYSVSDITAPTTNASSVIMNRRSGGTEVITNGWTNNSAPHFSWTAGADNDGGSGLKGYCLYLGLDNDEDGEPDGDPATAKGLLGTSPVSLTRTTCQFIVSGTSVDFGTISYKGVSWLETSSKPYILAVKAVDNAGNAFGGEVAKFQFRFDNTPPVNVTYLYCASGSFANVVDMSFSWPSTGPVASSDDNSGLLGWQYQINSTDSTWLGTTTEAILGINNYIPTSESGRTLTKSQDGSLIVSGNNIVYLRTVDVAGNTSPDATIRTCNIAYGGAAPFFGGTDTVTIAPATAITNSFALSYPEATVTDGQTVTHYYYMINTSPPSTLATLQGNTSTYLDNATSTTLEATALPNVNKGSNTVYVVAIDDASPPNYSPSNYITGTFTLNSTDPDNVGNVVTSDSSIKSSSQWNVTLTWTAPSYQGAGNLTYIVKRSTDGTTFTQVGTSSGLSYVDNTPSSTLYYYKIYSRDGANAQSSGTNAISITPTGKWTSAPSLDSGPSAGNITTKKTTITWSTSRTADSKVSYGTTSGSYGDVEPSNSSQVSLHSIQLTGLNPGTTYYYKTKWTDEDGNTGISAEKSFKTEDAPTVVDPQVIAVGLDTVTVNFTSRGASKVKIYYGTTTSFGGIKEFSTSTSETVYTTTIDGLADGTKYFYKINSFDSEGSEYEGNTLTFETLPRPKITNVRFQEVTGTAQPAIIVSWDTNTETSSIITYYPQGSPQASRDEVFVSLIKGAHKMLLKNLNPQTIYEGKVKGKDKAGNEAVSDTQTFTTSTDTRPPQVMNLRIEGSSDIQGSSSSGSVEDAKSQLVVSWDTDEPATSQVEFGEGTGTTYTQKTQEDTNLTTNHVIIISNLTPSKVYHLRTLSKDKAQNTGQSVDTVTITPKSSRSALELVIGNLSDVFGILAR